MTIAPVNNPQPCPINDLPEELTIKIFTEFTSLELTDKIMLVSRAWNRMASDSSLWRFKLQELNCNIIDEAVWVQHAPGIVKAEGISFEGLKPLDYRHAFFEVARFYARLKAAETSIKNEMGVTILTIPKGLSINQVHAEFFGSIDHIDHWLLDKLGNSKVDQAYRVIVTKNVLSGSRDASDVDVRALVEKVKCSLPKILEAMVLALFTEKSSSIRLFGDNPWTYTICSEILKKLPSIVGGFAPHGLRVSRMASHYTRGAAACRKL